MNYAVILDERPYTVGIANEFTSAHLLVVCLTCAILLQYVVVMFVMTARAR